MADLNSDELIGLGKLVNLLEKWSNGDTELYAQVVVKRASGKLKEPDEDVGIITFNDEGDYMFQGMNVDLRGIVKKQHNCRNCGTAVEVYANEAEEVEESLAPGEMYSTDGLGNTTKQKMPFTYGDGAQTVSDAQRLDQLEKVHQKYGNDGGASTIASEAVGELPRIIIHDEEVPDTDWNDAGKSLPRTFTTFDGSKTTTIPRINMIGTNGLGNVNNPNGFGNYE